MADLEAIAKRVLEKHCIVSGLVIHRPFDVACAHLLNNTRQGIHLGITFSPERDPILVRGELDGLRDSEELGHTLVLPLELQPAFHGHTPTKTNCWEERLVETRRLAQSRHPEIDMVNSLSHASSVLRIAARTTGVNTSFPDGQEWPTVDNQRIVRRDRDPVRFACLFRSRANGRQRRDPPTRCPKPICRLPGGTAPNRLATQLVTALALAFCSCALICDANERVRAA